jgi:hypothetical protein
MDHLLQRDQIHLCELGEQDTKLKVEEVREDTISD